MTSQLLDNEDKNNITMALARLDALAPEIERAKLAGFDVAETQERADTERKKLRAVKAAFFPEG